uniref:hypothetical protein n=1 Tax=Aeromonas caviae TaxID=648 RepID=UPI0015EF1532|nr:hypothetical protein [Aeromonas caviae]
MEEDAAVAEEAAAVAEEAAAVAEEAAAVFEEDAAVAEEAAAFLDEVALSTRAVSSALDELRDAVISSKLALTWVNWAPSAAGFRSSICLTASATSLSIWEGVMIWRLLPAASSMTRYPLFAGLLSGGERSLAEEGPACQLICWSRNRCQFAIIAPIWA